MWRVAVLVRRREGLPLSEFEPQWLDNMAPALAERAGRDERTRRVIVNIAPPNMDEAVSSVFPPSYDGLIEFWFGSADDAVAVMADLDGDAGLRKISAPIVDGARSVAWLAREMPCKLEQGSTVKFLAAGNVAEGITLDEAHRYWAEDHPRVARTAPQVWEPLTRYTQFHGKPEPGLQMSGWLASPRFVPMCSDMGYARPQDFLGAANSEQYAHIVRPDEEKFARPGEMLSFISGEERTLFDRAPA